MIPASYDNSVFINCPFDATYRPLFEAVVFTVYDCGFFPRCALEVADGSQVRIDKINGIIRDCRLAVHDISSTQLDSVNRLPRFNMPFEFGIFVGAKAFGSEDHRRKACIVPRQRTIPLSEVHLRHCGTGYSGTRSSSLGSDPPSARLPICVFSSRGDASGRSYARFPFSRVPAAASGYLW